MIFRNLGGLKLPDICLTGEEKPRKNLTQETCPDRVSNPGPLRDRRTCWIVIVIIIIFFNYYILYKFQLYSNLGKNTIYLFIFYSLLFRDASTSLVISRLGSLGVYQKAAYFYCRVVNVKFVKFTDFNFMIYEFDE